MLKTRDEKLDSIGKRTRNGIKKTTCQKKIKHKNGNWKDGDVEKKGKAKKC